MSDKELTGDDFIEFLNTPTQTDNLADEIDEWVVFMACPGCAARYPIFHSPKGETYTLCDECGWCSRDQ